MISFSTNIADTGVTIVVVAVVAIFTIVVVARTVTVIISVSAIAVTRNSSGEGSTMFSKKADNFSSGIDNMKCCNRREG